MYSELRRVLVCVTGMPGAGKSVIARKIASALKKPIISMGDIVREEAKRHGVPSDIESMMNFAQELRRKFGKEAVAKLTIKRIEGIKESVVIIDGVRSMDEIKALSRAGKIVIVAVHASPKVRFKRLMLRRRKDDPKSWEEFRERDLRELSFGIGSVIALADIMVINEGESIDEVIRPAITRLREELRNVLPGGKE